MAWVIYWHGQGEVTFHSSRSLKKADSESTLTRLTVWKRRGKNNNLVAAFGRRPIRHEKKKKIRSNEAPQNRKRKSRRRKKKFHCHAATHHYAGWTPDSTSPPLSLARLMGTFICYGSCICVGIHSWQRNEFTAG